MRLGSALLSALSVVATLVTGLSTSSCSYRNEDINRVVDPYWSKAYFNKDDSWYYRTTITDAAPEESFLSIGDGDWLMLETIHWEILQDRLVGWRAYPAVPGAEAENTPGSEDVDFNGQPVAIFRITEHFDIRREFDTGTGEESNVISENHDRQWYDRAFIRVDWSRNLVDTFKFHILFNQLYPTEAVSNNAPGNPKRFRFEPDYFEVSTNTYLSPDIFSFFQFNGVAYTGDTAGNTVTMRHSFMKVPKSDYVPIAMPPTVMLEDADGKEVRDADGYAVRVPINDRFGFFGTLGRNTFDANRGMVTSGQIFNASRFNVWKKSRNADGSVMPIEQREPKPIVYYTNVDHPRAYLNGSRRVAAGWNFAFRDMVAKAQPQKYTGALDDTGVASDVPEMFILRENSCSIANVKNVMGDLSKDLKSKVTEAAKRDGYGGNASFDGTVASVQTRVDHADENDDDGEDLSITARVAEEAQALADLERVCSALEYFTGGDATIGVAAPKGVKPFTYERVGDTRHSLMNVIPGNFQSGWSGLGPPYCDPITGETISATANVAAWTLDRSAARAAQWVDVMNGQTPPGDFLFGYDINKYITAKQLQISGLETWKPKSQAFDRMNEYFDGLKQSAGSRDMRDVIGDLPPGRNDAAMERVKGTDLEQLLISPDDITMYGGVDPVSAATMGSMDDAILEAVSPVRGNNRIKNLQMRQRQIVQMGQRAMDAPEMIDPLAIGRAIELRDLPYKERFLQLREDIYVAVMLHEVGHNTGLFHNMAGSSDSLNFGQKFWDLQALPEDINTAIDQLSAESDATSQDRVTHLQACADLIDKLLTDEDGNGTFPDASELDFAAANMTTQECLRQTESEYSSIMDYHANWNADSAGLGPYDLAAIKFGYGQLLEVFNDGALAATPAADAGRTLKNRIRLNDWKRIPSDIVDGTANVSNRSYVKMDWNTSSTRQAPLANEVPYKFGWGGQFTPDEKPFDFGADFQTNAKNELNRYYQHYFFSHFTRDRLLDYFDAVSAAVNSDDAVLMDFTEKMQWYFYLKATDPDFSGSYLEKDLLGTTLTGLNLFSQVMSHPANGLMVELRNQDVFGTTNLPTSERNTNPSGILVPWTNLDECTARQVAVTDADGVFQRMKPGLSDGIVPISEGRPFFLSFTDDYEDLYVKYVGTYWTKTDALLLMGSIGAWFPRADGFADPRLFDISWYRLFPHEVTSIVHALVSDGQQVIGPTVVPSGDVNVIGSYVPRNLINADGTSPDYSGNVQVSPSISYNHQYLAMLYGAALMSTRNDDTLDMGRRMTIALEGSSDDMSAFDNAAPENTNSFVHPTSGLTLRALRVGDQPISYDLVTRMNVLKDRFLELNDCVADMDDGDPATTHHLDDNYCYCIDTRLNPATGDCELEDVEPVGTRQCPEPKLRQRRDVALQTMDDLVDFANNLRSFNQLFVNF